VRKILVTGGYLRGVNLGAPGRWLGGNANANANAYSGGYFCRYIDIASVYSRGQA
jgi:hypothetical protein